MYCTRSTFSPPLPPKGSPTLPDRLAYTPILYYYCYYEKSSTGVIVMAVTRGRLNNKDDGCLFLSDEWITCLLLRHHKTKTCHSSLSCRPLFTTIYIFYNVFRSDIFVRQKIKSTAVIAIVDCVQYDIMSSNEKIKRLLLLSVFNTHYAICTRAADDVIIIQYAATYNVYTGVFASIACVE